MVNHNKPNNINYDDFIKEQYELSEMRNEERKSRIVAENRIRWAQEIGQNLGTSSISDFTTNALQMIKDIRSNPINVTVATEDKKTSLIAGYAIANYYIQKGYISPHEISRTNCRDAYENIHGMYEAKKWKTKFFNNENKLFIIEGCSSFLSNLVKKGDEQFWGEFLEFVDDFNKNFIIMYSLRDNEETELLGKTYLEISANSNYNRHILNKSKILLKNENIFKQGEKK